MPTERTPLLWNDVVPEIPQVPSDTHAQFCFLVGCPPSNAPPGYKFRVNNKTLYGRVSASLSSQNREYLFSATVSNALLLSQVVLGASLTALGAGGSPPIVITIFGVINTVIAGLVAWIKSRGQPLRSRMYRDDLVRVIDEINNSEIMWLGISQGIHGYEQIDTDNEVTVRSEVARLTRLYDRAVRTNELNNPEAYTTGAGQGGGSQTAGLRTGTVTGTEAQNTAVAAITAPAPVSNVVAGVTDPVSAPAAAPVPTPAPAPAPQPPIDPDQSPASAPPKPKPVEPKKEDPPKQEEVKKEEAKKEEPKKDDTTPEDTKKDKNKDDTTSKPSSSSSDPSVPAPPADNTTKSETTENSKTPATTGESSAPAPAPAPTPVTTPAPAPAPPAPAPAPQPQPTPQPAPISDPDASPATRPNFPPRKPSQKPDVATKVKGEDD